jgi:cytoskeletal protein RodZ
MSPNPIPSPIDAVHFEITTYSFIQWNLSSMRLSVLLIAILALYLIVPFGIQVYGSTNQCDPSVNQSCSQSSQTESKTDSETSQTPLILPDLSPTKEDLNDGQTDESAKTSDSNDNDDATTSTSTGTNDGDTTKNSADDNSDDKQESGDSSEDDGKDSGDGPSMIPSP